MLPICSARQQEAHTCRSPGVSAAAEDRRRQAPPSDLPAALAAHQLTNSDLLLLLLSTRSQKQKRQDTAPSTLRGMQVEPYEARLFRCYVGSQNYTRRCLSCTSEAILLHQVHDQNLKRIYRMLVRTHSVHQASDLYL